MKQRSKKYLEAAKKKTSLIKTDTVSLSEAAKHISALSTSKFIGTVELHIKIKDNDKKDTVPVRGSVTLPHSFGKEKRIIVFSNDPQKVQQAKELGAIEAGSDDLIEKIQKGWLEFDVAISEPVMMPKIAILGKVLGPKGIMPNPKNGTVTTDIQSAIKMYKSGKMDFKVDKNNIVHMIVGKTNMESKEIAENTNTAIKAVIQATGKSAMISIDSIYISPTMGPSIEIDKTQLI